MVCQRGIGRQLRGNEIRIDWRSGGGGAARHHGIQTGPHAQQTSIGDISPQKAVGGAWAPAGRLGPSGFELGPRMLDWSRGVLRDFGNMSSATLVFVLDRIMKGAGSGRGDGFAVAFGPGLAAESFRFQLVS